MYVGYEEEKNDGKFFFVSNLFFSINFGVKKRRKLELEKNCAVREMFRKKWRLKTMDEKVLELVKAKFWTNASKPRVLRAAS